MSKLGLVSVWVSFLGCLDSVLIVFYLQVHEDLRISWPRPKEILDNQSRSFKRNEETVKRRVKAKSQAVKL
jgi:hypothetical protein